jgi:hypothetical protein
MVVVTVALGMVIAMAEPVSPMDGAPPNHTHDDEPLLWKLTFQWIGERSNLSLLHPLDLDHAKSVMLDLSAVDERPPYADVKKYLAEIWPAWPGAQRQIRELWRRLERNPAHRFRLMRKPRHPFYTLDRLVEIHGLPSLDDRLRVLGERSLAACIDAINDKTADEFASLKAEYERVIRAMEDLRALRYGPASVGRWWDDFENPRPPAGTRGTIV